MLPVMNVGGRDVTNRRQFIQTGLAVSAASLALPHVLHSEETTGEGTSLSLELFVYDDRFAEAIEAARVATDRNLPVASMTRVLTELWYDELDLRWKRAPMTLAGMTTEHGLFVFETLALDRGMRVLSCTAGATDDLVSWVIGPRRNLNSA